MKTIKISGMSCGHCTNAAKEALEKLDGISNVSVDLDKGEASFEGEISKKILIDVIEKIGFEIK